MATGDPDYCLEHRTWFAHCQGQKHDWETDEAYDSRMRPAHPDCPSCRCATGPRITVRVANNYITYPSVGEDAGSR